MIDVRRHRSLPSTMDAAAALAHDGAAHGVVVVADEQTAGRGRRGTTWASPPGAGLYLSFISRPSAFSSLLTLAAGVAVRDGITAATGLVPDLKWPNDVIVGRRKLAGILAEGLAIGTPAAAVIIGAGINVQPAAYPPEVAARATSLEGELGRAVDADILLNAVVAQLWDRLALLERSPGDILRLWRAASPNAVGTRVEWDGRHGTTAGVDEDGALLVRTSTGIERIIAGELRWHIALQSP
ncbi:MAG TPA: biotin--[acetyl-CoA-carboxylase] ligase [Vicinamibacterales bacterium]|nr:biotin--[acetyl-CoA-carboxylase] ligase [Vicinamibacterales bacterium]